MLRDVWLCMWLCCSSDTRSRTRYIIYGTSLPSFHNAWETEKACELASCVRRRGCRCSFTLHIRARVYRQILQLSQRKLADFALEFSHFARLERMYDYGIADWRCLIQSRYVANMDSPKYLRSGAEADSHDCSGKASPPTNTPE